MNEAIKARNRNKSQVRAKVEHVIGVIKQVFGFNKVRYRGLAKNCTGSKSPPRSPICSPPRGDCDMRSRRVAESQLEARPATKIDLRQPEVAAIARVDS